MYNMYEQPFDGTCDCIAWANHAARPPVTAKAPLLSWPNPIAYHPIPETGTTVGAGLTSHGSHASVVIGAGDWCTGAHTLEEDSTWSLWVDNV